MKFREIYTEASIKPYLHNNVNVGFLIATLRSLLTKMPADQAGALTIQDLISEYLDPNEQENVEHLVELITEIFYDSHMGHEEPGAYKDYNKIINAVVKNSK